MAGIFNESVLTKKGIELLAKAQAGKCTIKLTGAVTGSGSYSDDEDLTTMTSLKEPQQTFGLNVVKVQNETNVYAKFVITNKPDNGPLTQGYYVKEIGIYAEDPDGGEILYAIATAVEDQWDYMPSFNGMLASTITVEFLIEVANASEVVIKSPEGFYIFDEDTGEKYKLGIQNGLLFYEEVEE